MLLLRKIFTGFFCRNILLLFFLASAVASSIAQPLGGVGGERSEQPEQEPLISLPYHLDPNAKIKAPDSFQIPAIRFLSSTDFFPFNYRDNNGRLIGYNIDLAKEICALLDIACTMQAWPWEQIEGALDDNQGDAIISGLAINGQSANRFDFSNIYLMLPARFIVKKSNLTQFDANNLQNKKISVRKNSKHEQFLQKYFTQSQIISFESELAALKSMQESDVFAYFGDGMRGSFWLNENINCCAFAGAPYFNSTYFGTGLAISLPIGRDGLRGAINYSLAELKRNGKLDELYLRWFPISFY